MDNKQQSWENNSQVHLISDHNQINQVISLLENVNIVRCETFPAESAGHNVDLRGLINHSDTLMSYFFMNSGAG